jgi:hypothetical protein
MADFDPDPTETEDFPPLGLTNPLLPPEPLGTEPLYPQFLMPVAAVPLMAANPALFFPEGLPGYQPPDNIFQESPFFIQAREALYVRQIEVLPEVSPRAPRPILSELLNELPLPEDFETPLEASEIESELTNPLLEELQAPNIEDILALEELVEVESTATSEAIEAEEPLAVLPTIDTSSLSPETTPNPISSPEESLTADLLQSESIITNPVTEEAELSPESALSAIPEEPEISVELPEAIETSEVLEPEPVAEPPALSTESTSVAQETELWSAEELSAVLTEPEVPTELPEAIETAEVIEPEITTELPALPIEAEEPVSQEAASPAEIPVSFIPPVVAEEAEETIEAATDVVNPESEVEETLQAPEPAEAQTAVEEAEEPILESPAVENAELLESPVLQEIEVPEEILPIIESSEGAEPLPELLEEAAIESSEETPPELPETPISTSEIIPEEPEEIGIVSEASPLEAAEEGAVTTSESALSLPVEITAEAENAETSPSGEQSLVTEEVPSSVEGEEPPVTPAVESIAAEQNVPEEAIAAISEPLAVSAQEMAAPPEAPPEAPIVEQGLENVPETEVSPLISRRQEFLEEQIEIFSGLEPQESGLEEAVFVPESASPQVPQESSANPETEIAETPSLEVPAPVLMPLEASAAAPENPLIGEESENLFIPNQSEVLGAPAEENLEVIPSLPTILENLGILTSLITSPPLAQPSNFLPISSEPFSSGRQMGMPFGLEQPMTFASPNILRQIITRREENSVAPTPVLEPSLLTTPNSPEPPEQNLSGENQSAENTQEAANTEAIATNETITAEASVSPRQEELLQSLEEAIPLPIVTAPSVMRSSGNYIPLTFAPRPARGSRSTAQQERASSFSSEENIPTEWSSIQELISGNSSSSGEELTSSVLNPESINFGNWENLISFDADRNYSSPEGAEKQGYSSTSLPLEDSDEEPIETSEDEEVSIENIDEEERDEPDLEYLAQEIYSMLQQRLAIERERQGFYTGRLPW